MEWRARMNVDYIRFTIEDINVVVRSDLRELLPELTALYPETPDSQARRTIRVDVRETSSRFGRRRYRVSGDGTQVGGELRRNEVFPFVEWAINLRVIETRSEFVQLHAASMVHRGNGFIFAGASGAGKSTLAAGLMWRGWKYLCDEFALIDPSTLLLHPFPKPICIKAGAFPAMRRLGLPLARRGDYIKARKGRVAYINPLDVGQDAVGSPAPARFVIFPDYAEGRTPQLHPMQRAHALMELAGCVFNRHVFADQALPILSKMIGGAQCFRLESGQLEDTCDYLESELCVSRAPPGSNSASVDDACAAHVQGWFANTPVDLNGPTTKSSGTAVPKTAFAPRNPEHKTSGFSLRRRQILKQGAKLAYLTPAVIALSSQKAFAAASNPSGICSTGVQTGDLCETDTDCCSGDCDFGVCK